MHVSDSKDVPFEGFSLERSTSFSSEHDELASPTPKFQECKVEDVSHKSKPSSQKHTKQDYYEDELLMMNQKGHRPLERKPFVFEKGGKLNVVSDHIEEIKGAA